MNDANVAVGCLLAVGMFLVGPALHAQDAEPRGSGLPLSPLQLKRLDRALESQHSRYDPEEKMIRKPFSSPGYHTTLSGGWVHPTRDSLWYAVALLDTGREPLRERAVDILRRVVALQDKNPESRTYGIWSWFLEEPLEKMSPPDWNWADFCGTALLQVALDHRERLPEDLRKDIDAAILHAARSIRRRNVGPGYTNIAIMGAYVTLVTAETYDVPELREYALERLRRFVEYTFHHGAFTEYNSPTYTVVALEELGRMRLHFRDPEARKMVDRVYRLAWEEIAHHFHAPTRQWAGPHSRCYRTLLSGKLYALLLRATDGRVDFGVDSPDLLEQRLPLPCPRDLEPYFTELEGPRDLMKTFVKGERPVVGTTHLEPTFALGSVNRGDLWNQRQPLVAYWGAHEKPSYLRLRCLHDDYDFSAARVFSRQQGGVVIAAVNFAVDGGDRHVSLDRIRDGRIHARDLRLRFEFGGAAGKSVPDAPSTLKEPAALRFGDLKVLIAVPYATFGDTEGRWEAGADGGRAWLDVVLFSGEEREVNLLEIERAAVGLVVRLSTTGGQPLATETSVNKGRLRLRSGGLGLSIPVRPDKARALALSVKFD